MSLDAVFESFPQLETGNLTLRRILPEDAQAFFEVLSDDEVTRYYDEGTYRDPSQAVEQIQSWENGYRNRRCLRWGIVPKGGRELIGTCGYYGFHTWHLRASIGYELGRSHWRRGIMFEALTAILGLGFEQMDLNRIDAVVIPGNAPSIGLLEKLGFSREGILREYENWGEKGFTDLCMLSLLRKTWNQPGAGGNREVTR